MGDQRGTLLESSILWAEYFMIEQGYDINRSLLYQDNINMGAILLEINGKASSSKKSKHF